VHGAATAGWSRKGIERIFMGNEIQNGKTLYDYLFVLYKRRIGIVIIVVSSVITAGAMGYLLPPKYQAKALFYVVGKPDTISFVTSSGADDTKRVPLLPVPSEDYQAIFIGFLKSRSLMEAVGEQYKKSYSEIKKNTDIRISNEYLIEVYVRDKNRVEAANIANYYPKALDNFLNDVSYNSTFQKKKSIEAEIELYNGKLLDVDKQLLEYKNKNKSVSISDEMKRLEEKKVDYLVELQNVNIAIEEKNGKIIALENALQKELVVYKSSPLIINTEGMKTLQEKMSDIEASIAAQKIEATESHPEMRRLYAQRDKLKEALKNEVEANIKSLGKDPNSFYENLRRQYISNVMEKQTLNSKGAGIKKAITSMEERLSFIPRIEQGIDSLTQQASHYRKTMNNLRIQLGEAEAQEKHRTQNVVVVSPANTPTTAVFPEPVLNMVVALLLGIASGIFYSFFAEYIEINKNMDIEYIEPNQKINIEYIEPKKFSDKHLL
jgi:uncharacterized protein involved in exopolysaccharide biosynthesis